MACVEGPWSLTWHDQKPLILQNPVDLLPPGPGAWKLNLQRDWLGPCGHFLLFPLALVFYLRHVSLVPLSAKHRVLELMTFLTSCAHTTWSTRIVRINRDPKVATSFQMSSSYDSQCLQRTNPDCHSWLPSPAIGIDTKIEVIVVSPTTWEAHHSPRAKPSGCGELPRSLVTPQWPKSRYQFLFYHDASKHIKFMQIRVCISRKSLIKLLHISHYGKHGHRPLSQQLP